MTFARYRLLITVLTLACVCLAGSRTALSAEPPFAAEEVSGYDWLSVPRTRLVKLSEQVLARPDIPLQAREVVHRIRVLDLDWDIAGHVYQPRDPARIPTGPDGRQVGVLLLHGGSGDHRSKDAFARLLVAKFGYKVVSMSYPGRLNLNAPDRDWPGDTIHGDDSVRTPVWKRGESITPRTSTR